MEKIPTMFIRDVNDMRLVTDVLTPGCEWVLMGEGTATVKKDGTNIRVTVSGGILQNVEKRKNPTREEKAHGAEPGYVPASRAEPTNKHIFAAVDATDFTVWPDGSWPCEALGPKIQGGKESPLPCLYPFSFAPEVINDVFILTFFGILSYLNCAVSIEGIVFHHPDGRMAKIKSRDFGIYW